MKRYLCGEDIGGTNTRLWRVLEEVWIFPKLKKKQTKLANQHQIVSLRRGFDIYKIPKNLSGDKRRPHDQLVRAHGDRQHHLEGGARRRHGHHQRAGEGGGELWLRRD